MNYASQSEESDHFSRIYTCRAADYHRLIEAEDVEGNLLPALEQVVSLRGKRILDLGTGTGRLPLLCGRQAAQIVGLDLHGAMLWENQNQRRRIGQQHYGGKLWELTQADMRTLPFPTGWAEIVMAGWAIGHMRTWFATDWRRHIGQVLGEMQRVATPGGTLIILETLTTGSLTPVPPTAALAEYYLWLEEVWGFTRHTFRTDYRFSDVDEAVARTEFFFGPALSATIRERGWVQLPEWTGLWSRRA